MKRVVLMVVLLMSIAGADTIYFKPGDVLENCRIVEKDKNIITVEYNQSGILVRSQFSLWIIDRIEPGEFDLSKISTKGKGLQVYEATKSKLNYKMLPVSIFYFVCAHSYYISWQDQNDLISKTEDLKSVIAKNYIRDRDRYAVYFFSLLVAGVMNTAMLFEKVEVQPTESGVQVSYKF